jgi:hypothetical protein
MRRSAHAGQAVILLQPKTIATTAAYNAKPSKIRISRVKVTDRRLQSSDRTQQLRRD